MIKDLQARFMDLRILKELAAREDFAFEAR
jgi:hypothetical protein